MTRLLRGSSLSRRRRTVVVVLAAGVVAGAIAVAAVAVSPGSPTAQQASNAADDGGTGGSTLAPQRGEEPSRPGPSASLNPVSTTDDPARFAELVARALFEWDTTTRPAAGGHVARLVDIADPTGAETPGLVADLRGYLPSDSMWAHLRKYRTRQWLEVDAVVVPSQWPQAVAEAPAGYLLPGTTAYTVNGVRHRAGVWEGRPVTTEHQVAFTVFMVCAPSYEACRLLRLSRLDEPLP